MSKSGNRHQVSGDDSLRFIHERPWLAVAIVGDPEGADRFQKILSSGFMPWGAMIDRWEQSNLSDLNEWKVYLKEAPADA